MPKEISTFDFLPLASAVVTVRAAGEDPRELPATWIGMVCAEPVVVLAGLGGRAAVPIGTVFDFDLRLPAGLAVVFPEGVGVLETALASVPAAEDPVRITCRNGSVQIGIDQCTLRGEVVEFFFGGDRFRGRDICRINPLARRGPIAARVDSASSWKGGALS